MSVKKHVKVGQTARDAISRAVSSNSRVRDFRSQTWHAGPGQAADPSKTGFREDRERAPPTSRSSFVRQSTSSAGRSSNRAVREVNHVKIEDKDTNEAILGTLQSDIQVHQSPMQTRPGLEKIVLNMGVGEARTQAIEDAPPT